jgi:predicted transcriptional regulator
MTVFVGTHLTDEMLNPLNFLANHMQRSKSFLIKDALKQYIALKLEELDDANLMQEIESDSDMLLARKNSDSKVYSSDQALAYIMANCKE